MSALYWILAGLAAARTYRLLNVDGAGSLARRWWDSLIWKITPAEAKGMVRYVRRKDVSRVVWRRYIIAKSLAEGWTCPYCIGYWITLAWVGTGLLWHDTWLWQLAAGGFALSYVVGHTCSRLDNEDPNDDR